MERTENSPERLYKASSRGIGLDVCNGCFVGTCGTDPKALVNNIACFVPSRETGEAIVGLFLQGARLNYRQWEPNWIQVKIGACDAHMQNLIELHKLMGNTCVYIDGPGINATIIKKSLVI